jgi:hypothetical protein
VPPVYRTALWIGIPVAAVLGIAAVVGDWDQEWVFLVGFLAGLVVAAVAVVVSRR